MMRRLVIYLMATIKIFFLIKKKLKIWVKFTYFLDYIWRQCLIETSKHDEKTLSIKSLERNLDIFSNLAYFVQYSSYFVNAAIINAYFASFFWLK